MRHRALQTLVGRAIVDKGFREQLLNGNRERVIAEFDLSDDELRAIRSIKAQSFEAFAGELHSWIEVGDRDPKATQLKSRAL